jgi:oligoribonuclease
VAANLLKPEPRVNDMSENKSDRLIWLDLEMTGLEPDSCTILEIATVVTTADLEVVGTGPNLAIHHPDAVLDAMDEWNTTHHTASGLVERVKSSKVDMRAAEVATLEFLREHVFEGKAPLCGNSISQDRRFLRTYMPELDAFFHYRNVDVSSIKEVVKRWYSNDYLPPRKKNAHLALDDVLESIEELRYYRDNIFVPSDL